MHTTRAENDPDRDAASWAARDAALLDAMIESRALWRDLCETIGDFIYETDRAGQFVFVWPPECLGWSADELIGRSSDIVLAAEAAVPGFDPFRAREPARLRRACFRHAHGPLLQMAVSVRPTRRGGVRGIGVVVGEVAAAPDDPVPTRDLVERIVASGRGEVLPGAMIRATLEAARRTLGAEGAAIVALPVGEDAASGSAPDPVPPAATVSDIAGEGWDAIAHAFAPSLLVEVALPELVPATPEAAAFSGPAFPGPATSGAAGAAGATVAVAVAGGRTILLTRLGARLGPATALAFWRPVAAGDWTGQDRRVAASLAGELRPLVDADTVQRTVVRLGRTDLLTGLLDGAAFVAETARRFGRTDHEVRHGTMLSLDLDGFGDFNRRYGLDSGDAVLREVAATLRDAVRPTDLVGRVGGDAFVLWLDGADAFAAAERADAWCHTGFLVSVGAERVRIDVAIGLASRTPRGGETVESLMRRADVAMLTAKRQGKAQWRASHEAIIT